MNPYRRAPRSIAVLLTWLALLVCAAPTAWAQPQGKRVALLIGNANYTVGPLRNPPNDVRVMDESLRALGFQTQVLLNANQNAMKRAVRDFGNQAQGADVAFLYYSGHGTQAGGENYLIPVQATIEKDSDYEVEAVSANALLRQIAGARPRAAIVVLDACRDNPLAATTKSTSKGLSRMDAPTGTMIAFATAPNTTASDEGHYARVLAQQLRQPGVELVSAFRATAAEVLRLSGNKQDPRISEVSINEYIYLAGNRPVSGPGAVATVVPEAVVPAPLPGQAGGLSLEDLKKEQAAREEWARWQLRMKADFDAAAGFTGAADLQVRAWERFAATWAQDNPYSREDDDLRQQARDRLGRARQGAQAAAAPVPATQPPVSTARVGQVQRFTVNGVSFNMVGIPAGSFMMGSPDNEPDRHADEGPQRRVSLGAFQLGQTEVTQGLWRAVMGDNPSRFSGCGADCPVEQVSWNDAQPFIEKLNQQTGQRFRLPSEAEWEYAARAGTTTPFHTGQTITPAQANFDGNSTYNGSAKGEYRQKTVRVGSFAPNAWGLNDMHGNVWEWVQDCYDEQAYRGKAPNDGGAYEVAGCSLRVLRGGSWDVIPRIARAAYRNWNAPDYRNIYFVGFRLARMLP